jgi:hypothetical protein
MAADVAHRVAEAIYRVQTEARSDRRGVASKESIVCNRHLRFIVAGLFVLPALAATAQEISDSAGGRFVVGQDGTPYRVMADGLRGVFVEGPDGTPYLVMGNRLRGALVDEPEGAASPIVGDGAGGRNANGPGD